MSEPISDPFFKLHDQVTRAHADIQHVVTFLKSLSPTEDGRKASARADRAIVRLQQAMHTLSMNPASLLGSIGGKKTAERGAEYFARIAAMRKTRGGGRPPKESA
jgi:hypothetical protein